MRIAAIDIGTNSIHMIVVQVRPDLSFEVIDREKDMVRLGAGGLDGRSLTPTAVTAALQTLARFKRLAESHQVDEIVAAATSATREADNGGDFIAEVERETGIRIRVITGTEEARLIHLAAAYGVDVGGSAAVVVDIGGGSVEVTLGTATDLVLGRSFKTGVIRLTERFVRTDPLARPDERRLVKFIDREMGSYLAQVARRGFERVIGTSGTILSLGAMAVADAHGAPGEVRNRVVAAKSLHTRTARGSRRSSAIRTSGGAAWSSSASDAGTGRSTRSRSRGWRSPCSTRPAAHMASPTANASGSSTPHSSTTSEFTSATSGTTDIPIT
jgi:exopolyphosphatase/guanosine-5'-triphosphate,3'-diphosphate pyrophosphatase